MSALPEGWVETTLGSVVDSANTGLDAIKRAPIVEEDTGIKCLRIQDVSQGKPLNAWGNTSVLSKDYEKARLRTGDLIMARTCSPGIVYFVKSDLQSVFNNGLVRIRVAKEEVSPTFLYYTFKSRRFTGYIHGISQGTSVQLNMKVRDLLGYDFYLPPLPEQKAIADMLSSFDEKIELLREQNKTLETLAQTIFKEWFVNFNYPDATGEMVDSELGEIPKGWRVGKLGDVVEIFDSKRVPLSSNERQKRQGIYPYYGATKAMDYIDDYLFDGTYLLMAEDGSVMDDKGYPFLQYVWGKFWVNNHTHILQGKNGFSTEALYVFLKKRKVASIVNGAVQLKINQKNLMNFDILIPANEVLQSFNEFLQPIFEKVKNNSSQIQTLSKTRDALLPKLMSGGVRAYG